MVHLQARVKVCEMDGKLVDTTMGRIILGDVLLTASPSERVDKVLSKKALAQLIDYTYRNVRD